MNIEMAITVLQTVLGSHAVKMALDDLIDQAESAIEDSPTQWDDRLVLPALAMLRRRLDIPDDIGGDED